MTTSILIIFLVVYLGMLLGELPYLQLDRTGVALLGAIALISIIALTLTDAAEAIHLPTIILLFSFMVLSAQMRLGGFYDRVTDRVTDRLAALPLSPPRLLGALILLVAGPMLALVSTFAGNLLIVGSIANIIVVASAARRGIRIDWRRHARVGVPVTLMMLAICAVYLWLRGQLSV